MIVETQEEQLQDLIKNVSETIGDPVNKWAVASTLESMGLRDIDIQKRYGSKSVFELSEFIYRELKRNQSGNFQDEEVRGFSLVEYIKKFLTGVFHFFNYYKYGLMYVIPMLTQVVALFWFQYSLWAYLYFNVAQATIIAIGTMVGFIMTGGIVQVLGRVASFYVGMQNYKLAKLITQYLVIIGIASLLGVSLLLFLFNIITPFYPQSLLVLSIIYGVLIGFLILAGASLYALKKTIIIAAAIIIGTALVIVNVDYFHLNIYFAQWLGITASILLMLVYSALYFRIKVHSTSEETQSSILPRIEVIFYENYRYFLYGFLYFLFLFLDRIMAWSAGPPPPSYIVWFRTPYELGMDWALLSLILIVGALEYSINSFSKLLLPKLKETRLDKVDKFNKYFLSFYFRQLLLVLVVGGLSILFAYYSISYLKPLGNEYAVVRDFFASHITYKVFWIASIGYLLLAIGLLHTLFFFTLSRPKYVIYSLLIALVVNLLVGFVLSRVIHYEDAVYGLAIGSFIFAVITGFIAVKFFKRMDYYYYSAY